MKHTQRPWLRLMVSLSLLVGLLVVSTGMALHVHAASLTVTDCSGEFGTGRIGTVISSASAGDTITFSCSGTIPISSTLTISTSNLTLDGSGQTVTLDGQKSVLVLAVTNSPFTLNTITVANGSSPFSGGLALPFGGTVNISNSTFANNSTSGSGGGLSNAGAGGGTVNISNSVFTNNSASSDGGALFLQFGTVNISNSTFTNNSASHDGGGIDSSTLTISNSTFANNSAANGGGLVNTSGGTLTISNSTFASNSALDGGGLIGGGTINISNSTFASNLADRGGGIENGGTMSITNSTLSGNTGSLQGGGLENGGTVTISNSTFANNSASGGGGIDNGPGTVNISGSIVANNSASFVGSNCTGTITDKGYNLESANTCHFTNVGSLQNTNPLLDALASNGGPTQTMALLTGSPAIDAGPNVGNCPTTDQRGVSRPDNGESSCDIGAYEFVDPVDKDLGLAHVPSSFAVDATGPQGATVTYTTPTATDESGDTSTALVTCTPTSGSTFTIGATQVTCTATDSDDTNSPVTASFTVTVNGAATQVNEVIATLNSFKLPSNTAKSFIGQLQVVQADLSANNTAQTCIDLTSFINHVQAQSGKQLTVSQANQLLAAAMRIQAVLGC